MALSDEDLRHRLTELGCDVGPIDDTTRPLYVSLLKRRESDAKPARQGRSSTTPASSSKNRTVRNRSVASSADDEVPVAPAAPKRNVSPKKTSVPTTNRRKRDSSPLMPSSSSTMYISSQMQYPDDSSLLSAGLSPVRPQPSQTPTLSKNKYTRRPLHPPNYNYSGTNGFSDDESEYRYRPSTTRHNGTPYVPLSHSGNSSSRSRRHNTLTVGSAPSHPISKLLVGATALFFCGLAVLYFRQISSTDPTEILDDRASFKHTLCSPEHSSLTGEGYTCINEDILQDALDSARKIQAIVSQEYYEKLCGNGGEHLDSEGGLTYSKAASFLEKGNEAFNGMLYLMQENPVWGMELGEGVEGTQSFIKLSAYSPPLLCKMYRAVMNILYQILLLFFGLMLVGATYWLFQRRKHNQKERKRQINGLVEDIVEMLTNNAADNPETPYLAVLEIRDKLLPSAAHNKYAKQLWAEVEEKFEAAESARVAKEKQRIHGEWFVVWRWLRPPNANGGGKVWQGKAFDGNHRVQPLTNCLKIRNMFNKTEEHGDGWVHDVRRAIVSNCGPSHGITHVHVEQNSEEGLVFVKTSSLQAAGDVYHKLHGSWFDGRLVTAKYLREERYHEKFPDSRSCVEPISVS